MPGSLSSNDSNQPKILDEVRRYLRFHMSTGLRGALAVMAHTRQLAVLFW
jgi:hypothetical protein